MDILKSASKPIEKLIETVSQGIGILYEPQRIRRKADAEAYRIEKIEEAKAKGLILRANAKLEITERAQERVTHREINRQINLESVVEKATKHLGDSVSDKPVDEDWRTRFFNKAQDVTSEEMQEIWGKILAEEVTQPGKISFRTLEIISNLSKKEAQIFEKACTFTFLPGTIFKINSKNSLEKFGLKYDDILILRSAGLIYESDNLLLTFQSDPQYNGALLKFGARILICRKKNTKDYVFEQIMFTPAGVELLNIVEGEKDLNYLEAFMEDQKRKGMTIEFVGAH